MSIHTTSTTYIYRQLAYFGLAWLIFIIPKISCSQGFELVSSGTVEGLPKNLDQATIIPKSDGRYYISFPPTLKSRSATNELIQAAYLYDFKVAKDVYRDEDEKKKIEKGKPDPEIPTNFILPYPLHEVSGEAIIKYDPYTGKVSFSGKNIKFKSVLDWYLLKKQRSGRSSNVPIMKGEHETLEFTMYKMNNSTTVNGMMFTVFDRSSPNMIPKYVNGTNFTQKLTFSENHQYVSLIRANRSFLEIGYYAVKAKKYFYFYLNGDYSRPGAVDNALFDNVGNLYLLDSKTNKWNCYNPALNRSTHFDQLDKEDPKISAVREFNAQYSERVKLSGRKTDPGSKEIIHLKDGYSFSNSMISKGIYNVTIKNQSDGSTIHEQRVNFGTTKAKKSSGISFIVNPYTSELIGFDVLANKYLCLSFKNLLDQYKTDNPGKVQASEDIRTLQTLQEKPSAYMLRVFRRQYQAAGKEWPGDDQIFVQNEVMVTEKVEKYIQVPLKDGIVAGKTVNGVREGNWEFKSNNNTRETWKYEGGFRTDELFEEVADMYSEATKKFQQSLYSKNLSTALKEYQKKVERSAQLTKILNQAATIGAGSLLGSELGMDKMNSLEFGMALNEDIKNGTTSNIESFFDSYTSYSVSDPNYLNYLEESMGIEKTPIPRFPSEEEMSENQEQLANQQGGSAGSSPAADGSTQTAEQAETSPTTGKDTPKTKPDIVREDIQYFFWFSTKGADKLTYYIKFLKGGTARVVSFKEDPYNPDNFGGVQDYGPATWSWQGGKVSISGKFSGLLEYLDEDGKHKYGVLRGNGRTFAPSPLVPGVIQIYYPNEIKYFYEGK